MSLSASVPLTLPVTTPVALFGEPTVAVAVGALLVGLTVTCTMVVTTPRRPSDTVTVKLSVPTAPAADAAWRAAAVGV